jgi:glycosyltransferase involved in cell wall biosynthesis
VNSRGTVSVALCTHNGEHFLREQLESIFSQTVLPTEIVVSDDASSDSTVVLVNDATSTFQAIHEGQFVRVVLLRNPHPLGIAQNFARAIEACTGDVILLSDQDDVWHPTRVERTLAEFGARPELTLFHSDAELVDESGESLRHSLFEAIGVDRSIRATVHDGRAFDELVKRNIVTGATASFRSVLAQQALPIPPGWLHDEWLAIVASAIGVVDLTDERLIGYRQHGKNAIGASKLSFGTKTGRMLETGSERSARLLVRAMSLTDRFRDLPGVSTLHVEAVAEKLEHERMRSRLSHHRLARVFPIAREVTTRRYARFGRGILDAVRDLLQPLAAPGPDLPRGRDSTAG